jgi:hypothetical protein
MLTDNEKEKETWALSRGIHTFQHEYRNPLVLYVESNKILTVIDAPPSEDASVGFIMAIEGVLQRSTYPVQQSR